MKLWWMTKLARLRRERSAVEDLAARGEWFSLSRWICHRGLLCAEGTIIARGVNYPVRLVYPDQFPSTPAWVEPQGESDLWSKHQYGAGGPLCLELRPDNWDTSATGADVLRSAFNLLHAENPLGAGAKSTVPSAHQVGAVQSYDWGRQPVLIASGCLDRIIARTARDLTAIRWRADDDVWPVLVSDAIDRAKPEHPPSFDLGTLRIEIPVVVGDAARPATPPENRAALAAALGVSFDAEAHKYGVIALAVGSSDATPYHSPDDDSAHERKWVVLADDAGARSGRTAQAAHKSAAVVGLGSVGSKLAETLLRSGVRHLVLVDGDVLLPSNLERHTLDWRDVGFRKAAAVKRRLERIVPGASIEAISENCQCRS